MNPTIAICAAASIAYLIGAIPFGYLVSKYGAGVDIRKGGSGNIGATNVGRVVGKKWGLIVLGLDYLKGLLSAWLLAELFSGVTGQHMNTAVACGSAAIVGHMFPVWLGFRGGKGVATALGAATYLSPWGNLIAFVTFVAVFSATRIVSLSSILGVTAFALFQIARTQSQMFSAGEWPLTLFSLGIPALIVFQHRANIQRLLRGEEPKFQFKKNNPPSGDVPAAVPQEPDRNGRG